MRDIPVFTTQYGVASLTLKEIPYSAEAYFRIQHTTDPERLIEECVSFCRSAGAEHIYATGHTFLENYPVYTAVLTMYCPRGSIPDTDAVLLPVEQQNLEQWRALYNQKMTGVATAAYMSLQDAKQMLSKGEGYFIKRDSELLGIGIAAKDTIRAVASFKPGFGADVVSTLCRVLVCDAVTLEVASTNTRAISLYQRLGFQFGSEVSRWYKII